MGRLSPADFHAVYGFRRPDVTLLESSRQVCGLDYPFTLPRKIRSLGAARLVSTPSRLTSRQAWLGIATDEEVSPSLGSSASPVSQASTQVFLKSAAYAIPPRPREAHSATSINSRAHLSDFEGLCTGRVARRLESIPRVSVLDSQYIYRRLSNSCQFGSTLLSRAIFHTSFGEP